MNGAAGSRGAPVGPSNKFFLLRVEPATSRSSGAPLCSRQLIDLGRHYEIVLVQALDFVRVQLDRAVTPSEADVGVMAFCLGEGADLVDELHGFLEVRECEAALQARALREERPIGRLFEIQLGLVQGHWRNAAATGCADFSGQFARHSDHPHSPIWEAHPIFAAPWQPGRNLHGLFDRDAGYASACIAAAISLTNGFIECTRLGMIAGFIPNLVASVAVMRPT